MHAHIYIFIHSQLIAWIITCRRHIVSQGFAGSQCLFYGYVKLLSNKLQQKKTLQGVFFFRAADEIEASMRSVGENAVQHISLDVSSLIVIKHQNWCPTFCPSLAAEQIISAEPSWRTWLMTSVCETQTKVCVIYCFCLFACWLFLPTFLARVWVRQFFSSTTSISSVIYLPVVCVFQEMVQNGNKINFRDAMGFLKKHSITTAASQPQWCVCGV